MAPSPGWWPTWLSGLELAIWFTPGIDMPFSPQSATHIDGMPTACITVERTDA